MPSGLSFDLKDGLLRLTLHRPEHANAFGVQEAKTLAQLLKNKKDFRALLLTSQGSRCFCAGGDMRFYSGLKSKGEGLKANLEIRKALAALSQARVPTLAFVNGDCLGGGLELISAFDEVWSVPFARFGFWQRRIGLSFGWGGFSRLCHRLPSATVKRLALTGADLSAYEAREIGIVDQLIAPGRFEERLKTWLEYSNILPPGPVGEIKTLTERSEGLIFSRLWGGPAHTAALKGFKMRRAKT